MRPLSTPIPGNPSTMSTNGATHLGGSSTEALVARRSAALATPTDLGATAGADIAAMLTGVLADVFALYLKTRNFHWHMSGPHFRDWHRMLDDQATQLLAMTDPLAERCRKVGGHTLRSIGHISRIQRVLDNDADFVAPADMLAELRGDNQALVARLRDAHGLCGACRDIASKSLIELWIDQSEQRSWFLFEATRHDANSSRHTLAN